MLKMYELSGLSFDKRTGELNGRLQNYPVKAHSEKQACKFFEKTFNCFLRDVKIKEVQSNE